MKQFKALAAFPILFILALSLVHAQPPASIENSPAYEKFTKRPQTELSKLLYLLDRFKEESDLKVIFEGRQYTYKEALPKAKEYLARHYQKNEKAQEWVKQHCYRSNFSNEVIHLKYPDGNTRLMRDVLLEELSRLEQVLPVK